MGDRPREALDDANEIVSDLAYWVASCDGDAALRIAEGFGAALVKSTSMRVGGMGASAIALALAERANALSQAKDARHAGWLLLSLKVELLQLSASGAVLLGAEPTERLHEVDQIILELLQKGLGALTGG